MDFRGFRESAGNGGEWTIQHISEAIAAAHYCQCTYLHTETRRNERGLQAQDGEHLSSPEPSNTSVKISRDPVYSGRVHTVTQAEGEKYI